MPTPDLAPGNLMPAAPQVMATPETQVMAPVLNPAILAGMPAPDPALLASMNLSMPQVTLDTDNGHTDPYIAITGHFTE